eukprot:NODE_695_length_4670_cov_0.352439.p2 type:complete len:208 gc:universal NODE_695_length_4670_cov_0.352439:2467-3090(+)
MADVEQISENDEFSNAITRDLALPQDFHTWKGQEHLLLPEQTQKLRAQRESWAPLIEGAVEITELADKRYYISIVHDLTHFALTKTLKILKQYVHWPNMYSDVKRFIDSCIVCGMYKKKLIYSQLVIPGKVPIPHLGGTPFNYIRVDIKDMHPIINQSDEQISKLLTIVDVYSNWVEANPLVSESAEKTTEKFQNECVFRCGWCRSR